MPTGKLTFGKMRYPWVRPTSRLFFDGDINPEGIAVNWQQGATGLFASAFYTQLAERSGAGRFDHGGRAVRLARRHRAAARV